MTYNGLGRQLTAVKVIDGNDISASVFAYNDIGQLESESQALFGGTQRTVSYGCDQYGYRNSTTYPDGSTVIARTNTWDGQIDTLSRNQTQLVDYAYLGTHAVRRTYNTSTPVNTDSAYDHLGRITAKDAGSGRVKFTYTYDADENNIDKMYFHHRGSTVYNNYDYDDLDRLTRADYLVNQLTNVYEAFAMDDLGNRESTTLRDGSSDTYAVDTQTNRYTAIDSAGLAYDDAGSLTTDKDGYHYVYDYENRPVRIYKMNGQTQITVAAFDYDTQGRRIRKVDSIADTITLYYYSDNWQVLAEYNSSGTLQKTFVYGNYIDEVLLMTIHYSQSTNDYYYLHDHLYSPAVLLNNTGSVVERYEYDAYGTCRILTSGFGPLTSSQYGNSYYFTGRELDTLDNGTLKKMHYRHREYNPYMGRFYQVDPLWYIDGMNLYEYVRSMPVMNRDSLGLSILKFGTEEPYWGQEKKWKESQKIYNTDSPYDHWDEYLLMLDIKARVRLMIMLSGLQDGLTGIDLSDAIMLLNHFASNAGGEVTIDYPKMIKESTGAGAHYERNINDAISWVISYKNLYKVCNAPFVSLFEETDAIALSDSINWNIAIHGYSTWDKGENIKCNCYKCEFDWTLNLRDLYDWEELDYNRAFKIGVSPAELRLMHRWGVMQQFKVKGTCKTRVKIEWKRDKTGAWIYEPIYEPCR